MCIRDSASGADGKMAKPPSAERADPDAKCSFGSTHCYPSTRNFAPYILASLPNEVEVVRAWPEFGVSMSGAVRVWSPWAGESLAISNDLPMLAPLVASWTIRIRACRERVRGNLEHAR